VVPPSQAGTPKQVCYAVAAGLELAEGDSLT